MELQYFGGLSIEETAEALDVSPDTVKRDWPGRGCFGSSSRTAVMTSDRLNQILKLYYAAVARNITA